MLQHDSQKEIIVIRAIHKRLEEREEGFTLIELLVVVIIIGILAAIAIPVFLNQRERAWYASIESDLRNAAVEMETASTTNNGLYPAAIPANVQTSDGVTLALGAASNTTQFCLTGLHTSFNGGAVSAWYDSDAGGVTDTAPASC